MNTEYLRRPNEFRDLAVELLSEANSILDQAKLTGDFSERLKLIKKALRKSREADGLMNEATSFGEY